MADDRYSIERLNPSTQWALRWKVIKREGDGAQYVVAMDAGGGWACACPAWTMGQRTRAFASRGVRVECKHIRMVQQNEPRTYINAALKEVLPRTLGVRQQFGAPGSIASHSDADLANELRASQDRGAEAERLRREEQRMQRRHEDERLRRPQPAPPLPRQEFRCTACRELYFSQQALDRHIDDAHHTVREREIELFRCFQCNGLKAIAEQVRLLDGSYVCRPCRITMLQQQADDMAKEIAAAKGVTTTTDSPLLAQPRKRAVHIRKSGDT